MTFEHAPLGELVTFETRQVKPEDIVDGTAYVGLEHIGRGGSIDETVTVQAMDLKSAKFAFDDRHVLFGKLRPNLGKIARPSIRGVCSTDIYPVLPGARLDRGYLAQFLLTPQSIEKAAGQTSGANLPRISSSALKGFDIPLPSLPEQRRIAAILDQADELRTKRRRALTLLEEFADSNFARLFTGRKDDPTRSVEELLASTSGAIRTGPFGSQLLTSELVASGIPVLGIDNVVSNEFLPGKPRFIDSAKYQQLKKYTVRPGDVLITIMGTVGRCAVVPLNIGVAINTKHLCCITLDQEKCLPEYLRYYFLKHPEARNYLKSVSKGAVMDGLSMGLIRALPVRLPPISEQQSFVYFLRKCNDIRSAIQEEIVQLDELFASLQHRAFRGEL